MKVNHEETDFTKLCHARPGDVVQLVDSMCVSSPKAYLVCVRNSFIPSSWKSQGLYECGDHLALIDLESGEPIAVPHLSSRAIIYRKAEVNLNRALEASRCK